jgi:hypothetical protein
MNARKNLQSRDCKIMMKAFVLFGQVDNKSDASQNLLTCCLDCGRHLNLDQ